MGQHILKVTGTRGEISPLAHARRDTEIFQAGMARLRNWFVLKEGGFRRRSGTRYAGAAKYTDRDFRLIDFVYSSDQSYALEFGDEYVRFWTESGQVLDTGVPYEIASPYAEEDLPNLSWVQSKDVVYIAFRSQTVKPKKLIRTGPTDWSFADVVFRDGPYLSVNDVPNKVTPNTAPVTGATSTLTFENTDNINGGVGFVSTDEDRLFRVQFDGKWSWGVITTVTDDDEIVVTWSDGQGGTTPSLTWRLGAFSDTTGYPGAVSFFQGRVVWSDTPSNPTYGGYSYSGIPETFSPTEVDGTVTDASGGHFDIIAGDRILWMQEAPRLQIGTPLAIRSLGPQDTSATFGPRNISQRLEINEGVSKVRPAIVGPSTVHCSEFGRSINDLFYDTDSNFLANPEMSVASEHLFDAGVRYLTFQRQPYRRLVAVMNDGTLVASTVDRYEKVSGFSAHDVGGVVLTAQSVPGTTKHTLWLGVRRTINGVQKQFIETLDADFLRNSIANAFFVDCGGTYSGTATNTVTGITWLPNTEVDILADGRVLPRATVSAGGVLTLPNGKTATKVNFGLPIEDAGGTLLRPPTDTGSGASLGQKIKVVSVDVDLYETKDLSFVSDTDQVDRLVERPASKRDTALKEGMHRLLIDGSWTGEGAVSFLATKPTPATIRAINLHIQTEG